MRKIITLVLAALLIASSAMAATGYISVISRESGSGTRGAFIELTKLQVKGADGTSTDTTTEEAIIANATDIMLANVASDPNAIGYVSIGSLNDSVKALDVEGFAASNENVQSGEYILSRPFMIAFSGDLSPIAQDFVDYILSAEGQAIVGKSYVAVSAEALPFVSNLAAGKVVIGGSSSVTPVMEKLVEAYLALNLNATIEIQMSDSTTGMQQAISGLLDIGMASRELKEAELAELTELPIALDGIAVIVHPTNELTDASVETIRQLFAGEITQWADVK